MKQASQEDYRDNFFFSELDINRSESPALVQRVEQHPSKMHQHHDFIETVFVLEGSCVHTTSTGESYILGAGDFFIVPKGTLHSYSQVDGLKLINILVRSQFMNSALQELSGLKGFSLVIAEDGGFKRVASLPKDKLEACLSVVARIEGEAWEGGEGRDLMLRFLLSELLVKLFRSASTAESLLQRNWPDFGKIASYLADHIQRTASIEAMAKAGGVSKRTLLRRFKSQTGMSPMECLNQMRLSKACRLLRESSMDIKNIATSCGFPDSNYFSRQYRKKLGVSPRQFRKAYVMPRRPESGLVNVKQSRKKEEGS